MLRNCLVIAAALAIGSGCGPSKSSRPPADNIKKKTMEQSGKGASKGGDEQLAIVGAVEHLPADPKRRKIVIWGKVTHIIKNKHDQLPEAKPVSTGGVGDPVTEIQNRTPFKLTLWFAGECAHHSTVEARKSATVVFCPGKYNIAAVVEHRDYLPLVRENQEFKPGIGYVLEVVIRHAPKQ